MHTFLPYYYSIKGYCKDGFAYVLYINGGNIILSNIQSICLFSYIHIYYVLFNLGHPPWTLLGLCILTLVFLPLLTNHIINVNLYLIQKAQFFFKFYFPLPYKIYSFLSIMVLLTFLFLIYFFYTFRSYQKLVFENNIH